MMMKNKNLPRYFEVVFNLLYLVTVLFLGSSILFSARSTTAILFGIMALVLVLGDTFHLVPRVAAGLSGNPIKYQRMLGIGKMITSVGMTLFYVVLWHIGILSYSIQAAWGWTVLVYSLAVVRIALSVAPQNRWVSDHSPLAWNYYRNIPFFILGGIVGLFFFISRNSGLTSLQWMWLAILLSFAFYVPVVFGAKKYPKLGMLMIPKSCAYVWIIAMGLGLK